MTGGQRVGAGDFAECCLVGAVPDKALPVFWLGTGVLIHPRIVLTAKSALSGRGDVGPPNVALFAADDIRGIDPKAFCQIGSVHRHPSEDLAMLVLDQPSSVEPVERATGIEIANCDQVELVGYGNHDAAGLVGFGEKRRVSVPVNVMRRSEIEDLAGAENILGFRSRSEFVAGRKGSGRDSPNSDIGGPAYLHSDGACKLAGITSRASNETGDGCGDGGVYVRLDAVADWIEETIEAL